MSLPTFDWALVKSFLAVLDAGSLMGAARRLGAQQPTLSRHVAELEAQLGTPLFERTGRGVVPTAAALAIADAARQMGDGAETLARQLAGRRNATTGSVRITTSEVAAVWLLPGVLAELAAAEPGIQIELLASNALDNLLRREADIAVRMVRPSQDALVMKHVGTLKLGLFAHPDYVAAHGTPTSIADLAGFSGIGPDRTVEEVRMVAALFGMPAHRLLSIRTDSHLGQLAAIRAGAGIGICQVPLARRAPALVRILPDEFEHDLPTWVVMHEDLARVPRIRATFDHLVAQLTAYCAAG